MHNSTVFNLTFLQKAQETCLTWHFYYHSVSSLMQPLSCRDRCWVCKLWCSPYLTVHCYMYIAQLEMEVYTYLHVPLTAGNIPPQCWLEHTCMGSTSNNHYCNIHVYTVYMWLGHSLPPSFKQTGALRSLRKLKFCDPLTIFLPLHVNES